MIAEIPGTDDELRDQLVMIGGHLDSWQGSTGATDNAAGSAVMLEVVRILKTVGVKPRRTIRIALWGGEETGLHGSKNYVKNHFTDTTTKKFNASGRQVIGVPEPGQWKRKNPGHLSAGKCGRRPDIQSMVSTIS